MDRRIARLLMLVAGETKARVEDPLMEAVTFLESMNGRVLTEEEAAQVQAALELVGGLKATLQMANEAIDAISETMTTH